MQSGRRRLPAVRPRRNERGPEAGATGPGVPTGETAGDQAGRPAGDLERAAGPGVPAGETAGSCYGRTVIALMTTGRTGTFWCAPDGRVCSAAMASTTSIPSTTRPKTA